MLCNDAQGEGAKLSPDLASWLFCYVLLLNIWYGISQPIKPRTLPNLMYIRYNVGIFILKMQEKLPSDTIFSINMVSAIGEQIMPRETTNMPNPRSAAYREGDSGTHGDDKLDATLKIESMLLEEFNYATVTAYQAMEDRARMFNLYLLLVGVIASGLGAIYQLGGNANTYSRPLAIALLLIAGMVGIAFFVKLIRLRQAWRESVICMNVIKEFYIQQFQKQIPKIDRTFRWRLKTIPAGERPGSTTFIVCSTVALLESVCFAGAAFVWVNNIPFFAGQVYAYFIAVVILAVALLLNVLYYQHSLNKRNELTAIEEQVEEIESV